MNEDENRLMILKVSPNCLMFRKGKFEITENGLPDDVEFVECNYSQDHRCFFLTIRSKEFKVIESGELIPFIDKVPLIKWSDETNKQ